MWMFPRPCREFTTSQLAIIGLQKNYTKPLKRLGMIFLLMKFMIGSKDRLYTRYISLILNIFLEQVLAPNEVHQADVLYMPYDNIGRITYIFCLNIVDMASRYKATIPIGAYS